MVTRSHRLLTVLLALAAVVAAPAVGHATVTASPDRGGVDDPRLSAAERAALDITSVAARGAAWGLIVRVRFRGDVRLLGRGGLRTAMVAMVLRPRSSRARPAVLVTRGALGADDLLRSSRSRDVGVIRDGRQIDFLLLGEGLAGARRVEVKAFARRPRSAAGAAAVRPLTAGELAAILAGTASDTATVAAPRVPDPDPDVCELLREDARTYARQEADRTRERAEARRRGRANEVRELDRIIVQIASARSSLRPVLGRNRCFSIDPAFGYEHYQGFTRICGRFVYDIPVAQFFPDAYRLLRLNDGTGVFEELPEALEGAGLGSATLVATTFRITQYGTYRVVFQDPHLPIPSPVEQVVFVPPPEPQLTRDCG